MLITGRILDEARSPIARSRVRAATITVRAGRRALGETGTTNAEGQFELEVPLPSETGMLPHLVLRLERGGRFVDVSHQLLAFDGGTADFGTLVVFKTSVATALGQPVFALPVQVCDAMKTARPPDSEPSRVGMDRVVTDIGGQLSDAAARLAARRGGYRLGAVAIKLQYSGSTDQMRFPSLEELRSIDSQQMHGMELQFEPGRDSSTATERAAVTVPDVVGYTTKLAQRKLAKVDLTGSVSMREVTEPVDPVKRAAFVRSLGTVVAQRPKPGELVPSGSAIKLEIARRRRD